MVDEIRVLRLMRAVRDDLERLTPEASADSARRADPVWLPGVTYLMAAGALVKLGRPG